MSGKTSGGKLVRFGVVILIAVVGGWFVMSRIFSSSDHADEAPTQTTLAEESGAAEPQSTASSSPQGPAPANASSGSATGSELPEFGTAISTVDSAGGTDGDTAVIERPDVFAADLLQPGQKGYIPPEIQAIIVEAGGGNRDLPSAQRRSYEQRMDQLGFREDVAQAIFAAPEIDSVWEVPILNPVYYTALATPNWGGADRIPGVHLNQLSVYVDSCAAAKASRETGASYGRGPEFLWRDLQAAALEMLSKTDTNTNAVRTSFVLQFNNYDFDIGGFTKRTNMPETRYDIPGLRSLETNRDMTNNVMRTFHSFGGGDDNWAQKKTGEECHVPFGTGGDRAPWATNIVFSPDLTWVIYPEDTDQARIWQSDIIDRNRHDIYVDAVIKLVPETFGGADYLGAVVGMALWADPERRTLMDVWGDIPRSAWENAPAPADEALSFPQWERPFTLE